jgi:hypothetical protein
MKRLIGCLAIASALAAESTAQSVPREDIALPAVDIVLPANPGRGRMVVASAKVDKSHLPANLIGVQYQWTLIVNGQPSQDFVPWPDGTKLIFVPGPDAENFTVVLDVDFTFGDAVAAKGADGKDVTAYANVATLSPDLLVREVDLGTPTPPTPPAPPTPGPNPTPTPPSPVPPAPLPPGQYGLAQFTRDTLAGDSAMTPADRTSLARALSASFSTVATNVAAIAGYKDKGINGILADLKAGNEAAIRGSGVDYNKTVNFKKALGDRVYDLIFGHPVIKTPDDLATACREIGQGLDAVRQ